MQYPPWLDSEPLKAEIVRLVAEFESGDQWLDFDNATLGTDRSALFDAAERDITEACVNHGEVAAETLQQLHPDWPLERIKSLVDQSSSPTEAEVVEHARCMLESDEDSDFFALYKIFQVSAGSASVWVIIRQAVVPLEPEYDVVGIFETIGAADDFAEKSYSTDI